MKLRLCVFALVVVLVASVSSCARDEVAAGSGAVIVADESAASRQCRASVPSTLGGADLEALVKTEFGSNRSDGLFLTSFAAIGIFSGLDGDERKCQSGCRVQSVRELVRLSKVSS